MANLDTLKLGKKVFTGTFSNITSDQLLAIFNDGESSTASWLPIGDIDWERIVIDLDVTTLTGTNAIFKLKTCNNKNGTAVTATTLDAKDGTGTAVASATLTGAGRSLIAVSRTGAGDFDTNAVTPNIGQFIGLYADVTTLSDLDGTVTIYVGK